MKNKTRAAFDIRCASCPVYPHPANDSDSQLTLPGCSGHEPRPALDPLSGPANTLAFQADRDLDDRLLRLDEVLDSLQVSKSWLRKEISAGRFPAPLKFSHKVARWSRSDLRAWISRHANP